jgi:type II restriction/modification system DNA methylase subunit YeeA
MNTKNLKAYAPKARSQFIEAIKKRAAQLGIYQDKIADVQFEGGAAIIEGRAFTKKQGEQRKALERKIEEKPLATHKERYDLFIREMAYTWFNRLAAIRYMELHDYLDHGFRVLSNPNSADSLPEILDHASDVVDTLDPDQKYLDKNHIIELQLAGNKEEELYREMLLGQCHRLYNIMPFMFEAIDDATELLLPDNLTKTDSILKGLVNEIPEEDWSEIEVIGWLYQFYISEHKDSVIGKVVKSEDIPAATQLFTPNWIVKYLVQNSLGRQWLATYPESELKGKMEYYIEPAEQSEDVIAQLKSITPTSIDPEQIKVLDPAAGSGHILVEVYEVLREIYLERGYRLREIPELILTKNIYGLDIDDRAAQLASFALMMKAREDDRRIFQRVEDGEVALNVYSLQSTEGLDVGKLWQELNLEGNQKQGSTGGLFDGLDDENQGVVQPKGIYTEYFELLQMLYTAFLQAKTLGSLIQIDDEYLTNLVAFKELLEAKEKNTDPLAKFTAMKLLPIVNQAVLLAQKYSIVAANPPYMGQKYHEKELKKFVHDFYDDYKTDLYSVSCKRYSDFLECLGYQALMTPFTWMFLNSYEKMRLDFIDKSNISSLVHPEYHAIWSSAAVPICAFVIWKPFIKNYNSSFIRLTDFYGEKKQPLKALEAIKDHSVSWFYEANPESFKKIPSSPIAYWVTSKFLKLFEGNLLGNYLELKAGMSTGDNVLFQRYWFELPSTRTCFPSEDYDKNKKWFPCNSGGKYRKWYGNNLTVVNWENDGEDIRNFRDSNGKVRSAVRNPTYYFKGGITWTKLSSSRFAARWMDEGYAFDDTGRSGFLRDGVTLSNEFLLASMINNLAHDTLTILTPSMSFTSKELESIPVITKAEKSTVELIQRIIKIHRDDWDSFELSWNFEINPIVTLSETGMIRSSYRELIYLWESLTKEAHELEKEINCHIINESGLEKSISSDVPIEQITVNMNPAFRYKKDIITPELKKRFLSDSQKELLSYSVACMMGRYSLDRKGLVYANLGNIGFKELVADGAYNTFLADDDGIVPLASEDWLFEDDATARFREFVKTVWGDENLQENLGFVAESLCLHALNTVKGEGATDTVRRYFSKQFYKDHCQTYKKRPIYWLFSSGKEKAFECLVYLHRYNEGTLSRMRTEYVTPLMGKYESQHSLLAEQKIEAGTVGSSSEVRRIEKELKSLDKKQAELRTFDEQLKHYAEMRITLDLDDGVKANYGKFGNLLADVKTIHGEAPKVVK